ncbi:MAG: hypothetical protein H0U21_01125 [Acidimicrobiia bacterium]|nr:hypothetical protein [Acidimicrobiia bacterium]
MTRRGWAAGTDPEVNRNVPTDLDVHVILDNLSTRPPRRRSCTAADIEAWAANWNADPTPFAWHKTAEQILQRLAGYCNTINQGAET